VRAQTGTRCEIHRKKTSLLFQMSTTRHRKAPYNYHDNVVA